MSDVKQFQKVLEALQNSPVYQKGNRDVFGLDQVDYQPASPLNGKQFAVLGSSITYGFAAQGVAFSDYLQVRDGTVCTKSAISGTTLAGNDPEGYLYRLKHDFTAANYDAVMCQLSTNDDRQGKSMGKIASNDQRDSFDTGTTIGAIEEVCVFVTNRWRCPLIFFTCPQLQSAPNYERLIGQLRQLQTKWHFKIIDLYHDQGVNASLRARPNAMFDAIHPTQEGYLKVWLPVIEKYLVNILG